MTWRTGLAIAGFIVSLAGLLLSTVMFRLLVLVTLAFDFGTTEIELLGIPVCIIGWVLCLFGPRTGAGARLSRVGVLFAVAGLLFACLIGLAFLFFDGGSV